MEAALKLIRDHRPDLTNVSDTEIDRELRIICDTAVEIFRDELKNYTFYGKDIDHDIIDKYRIEVESLMIMGYCGWGVDWALQEIDGLVDKIKDDTRWSASAGLWNDVKGSPRSDKILSMLNDLEFDYSFLARRFKTNKDVLHIREDIKNIREYLSNQPKSLQVGGKEKGFVDYLIYDNDSERDRLLGIVDKYFKVNQKIGVKTVYFVAAMYQKRYMSIPQDVTEFRNVLVKMGCDGSPQSLNKAMNNINPVNPVSYENEIDNVIKAYFT